MFSNDMLYVGDRRYCSTLHNVAIPENIYCLIFYYKSYIIIYNIFYLDFLPQRSWIINNIVHLTTFVSYRIIIYNNNTFIPFNNYCCCRSTFETTDHKCQEMFFVVSQLIWYLCDKWWCRPILAGKIH